jgi:8-oxoguanine deaminase
VLDLSGHILLPGLINCHHHLDQVLTRNLPAGQNTNLFPWLKAHESIGAAVSVSPSRGHAGFGSDLANEALVH